MEIQSVDDLVTLADDLEGQFLQSGRGFAPIWYRGQADARWPLLPTALRQWFMDRLLSDTFQFGTPGIHRLARERGLNREFRRMATSMLPTGASPVDVYLIAQHTGMPTRLLDWSTNPQAALFFAVCSEPDADGVLFSWLPRTYHDGRSPDGWHPGCFETREPLVEQSIGTLFAENDRPGGPFIIPIMPGLTAGRMLQQGSQFTLHMPPAVTLGSSEPSEPALEIADARRHVVPRRCKRSIQLQLRRLSVHWATLFPDCDHVAREIRTAWELYP